MPKKEAWSQSGFYAVFMRSENEKGGGKAVNPDHKTLICGLNAVFVWLPFRQPIRGFSLSPEEMP
jgi:hypothetical protein